MKLKSILPFIILLQILALESHAQPANFFVKRGNNITEITCNGITFSPPIDANFRAEGAGAVWVKKQIDLKTAFDISFFIEFTDTTAVDGAAFVLQPDSNSLGASDNGLGYKGVDHSIAITFDAVQNSADNDPAFDHVTIQSNGDINHSGSHNLAGPISIEPYYSIQINPGYPPGRTFYHLVRVKWDPGTINFAVYIDGNPLIALQYDLIQKIFNGKTLVYWGFTASNTQKKMLPSWFRCRSRACFILHRR